MYDEDLIEDSLALVKELRERMGDKKTGKSGETPKMEFPKAELPKPVDLSALTAGTQDVTAGDPKQDEEARRKKEAQEAAVKAEAARRAAEVQAAREAAAVKAREEAKLRAQEEARLAAEKARREEEARLAADKARREEEARLAAEKARQEEEARLAAEKARKEEEARLAAEKARREEEARLAAEKARREEEARLAAEKARKEEEARLAAEKARQEEEARLAAEKARREEAARLAAEKARKKEVLERERARLEEEKKRLEEQIAAKKAAEEARKAAEAEKKAREEARKAEEAEKKAREEARRAAEARRQAGEEEKRATEARRQAEEDRKIAENETIGTESQEAAKPEVNEKPAATKDAGAVHEKSASAKDADSVDDAGAEEAAALDAESIRALPDDKSYEVTIHLDFTAIRNFFVKLIDKLKPEERTLEDVNEAMEENRRLQAEEEEVKAAVDPEEVSTPKQLLHKSKRLAKSVKRSVQKKIDEAAFGKEEKPVDADGKPVVAEGEQTGTDTEEEEFHLPKMSEETKEKVKKVGQTSNRVITNMIIVLICVAIAYFAAAFLTNFVMYETTVDGESMEMALDDGDSLLVQKISYYFKDPQRYDVIVFSMRDSYTSTEDHENKKYLVKRVIGLPGETVQIMDGCVYINGEKLEDDHYGSDIPIEQAGIASDPQTLGENQYFVLGDNREVSEDSREFGIINKSNIEGKAFLRIWPFRHLGSVK